MKLEQEDRFWLMVQAQDEDRRAIRSLLGLEDNPVAAPPIAHVRWWRWVHTTTRRLLWTFSRRQRRRAARRTDQWDQWVFILSRSDPPAPASCPSAPDVELDEDQRATSLAPQVALAGRVAWWRAGFLVPGLGTSVAGFGSVGKADEEVRGQRPTVCVGPTVAGRDAQKHKLKIQAWSSLVFHCRHSSFNPFEAPPWDSRPEWCRCRSLPITPPASLRSHGSRPRPTRHNYINICIYSERVLLGWAQKKCCFAPLKYYW